MRTDFSPYMRFVSKTSYYIDDTVIARDLRIIYVLSGNGIFETDGIRYRLSPNTLIAYPYGIRYHITECSDDILFYTINYDFCSLYRHIPTMIPISASKPQDKALDTIPAEYEDVFLKASLFHNAIWAEEIIARIYEEAVAKKEDYDIICDCYLKILITNIYRKSKFAENSNPVCQKVKKLINKDLKLNIQSIADKLNYHPYYLNEVFVKNEGMTLHKYITAQRLIKAREMLLTTDISISEISHRCGFCSQAHLCSAFKSVYKITPGKIRRL